MRDEMRGDIVPPPRDIQVSPVHPSTKEKKWPELSATLIHMGGRDMGKVEESDLLPAAMGEEAKIDFLKEKPIKLFVFPGEIKVYLGKTDKPDGTISAAVFRRGEYLGYDDEYTIDRLLQKILYLSGVIKLKMEKEDDVIVN